VDSEYQSNLLWIVLDKPSLLNNGYQIKLGDEFKLGKIHLKVRDLCPAHKPNPTPNSSQYGLH
jgi:hypothetical protein